VVKGIGAEVGFGYVAADEYGHEASKAQHGDKFIGLAMDMDNEGDKKDDRIGRWVSQLATEGFYAAGAGGAAVAVPPAAPAATAADVEKLEAAVAKTSAPAPASSSASSSSVEVSAKVSGQPSWLGPKDVFDFASQVKPTPKTQAVPANGKTPHHSNHDYLFDEAGAFPAEAEGEFIQAGPDGDFIPFYNSESGYTVWISTKNHRLSYYTFDAKGKK
jgi:hypothetical protein